MFAYCNNNPVLLIDENGEFPWLSICIIAVCVIVGGVLGFTSDTKLGSQKSAAPAPANTTPQQPTNNIDTGKSPAYTTSPQIKDGLRQEQNELNTPEAGTTEELSLSDRVENMFIGAGIGLAVGGAITSVVGAAGSAAAGSAYTYIAAFGGTGAQTVSIGAIAYDLFAMVVAPFFGVEMETIEIEP